MATMRNERKNMMELILILIYNLINNFLFSLKIFHYYL